jgi:hypothetical protein
VNRALNRLAIFSLFFLPVVSSHATNPDLTSAPAPELSQAAWRELNHHSNELATVTLHARLTARRGSISTVTIEEADHWPISSAEVQTWINQHWKFVSGFSGTVVQPVSFRVVRAAPPVPTPAKTDSWGPTDYALFQRAPKPEFPNQYLEKLRSYIVETHYKAGLLLSMTVRQGAIVDIRIVAQKGPSEFAEYSVKWVREHWVCKPNVSGTYTVPIYYGLASN